MDEIITSKDIVNQNNSNKEKKKKSGIIRYVVWISIVLVATGLALFLSIYKDPQGVFNSLKNLDYRWVLAILAVVTLSFVLDGFIIFIFMRLYTRKYHMHQGILVSMIGSFYGSVTPGGKGGQVMQAYTLKKQGTQISNAASILVMYFILYRVALVMFDIVAVIFKFSLLNKIGSVPITLGSWSANLSLVPLTIIGFVINVLTIGLLFMMSYSHRMHNFVMHYGIGFLAKVKLVKDANKKRESLRIQVENFKIELRRLFSNIPITVLIIVLFILVLMCNFSIPWFAGMAVNGYGYHISSTGEIIHTTGTTSFASVIDSCFLSSYHQMISGLIPIPGGAGISEVLFLKLFENYYTTTAAISTAQIIWRASTFHLVLLVCGLTTALYKASPKEQAYEIDRRTFVTMQFETYEERKKSSDESFEHSQQIFHKDRPIKEKETFIPAIKKEEKKKAQYHIDDEDINERSPFAVDSDFVKPIDKSKKDHDDIDWGDFGIR